MYHKDCLTWLYNRYHQEKTTSSKDFRISTIEGVALSEVVEWIKDSMTSSYKNNIVPVFQQKDIVEMYNNQLIMNGASPELAKSTHFTRLKPKILNNMKSGKVDRSFIPLIMKLVGPYLKCAEVQTKKTE